MEKFGKSNHPSGSLIGPGIRAPASYACRLFCEEGRGCDAGI